MNRRANALEESDQSIVNEEKSAMSLEDRLRLFDQATLRQELRSIDQLKRVGVERSALPTRESLYDRGCRIPGEEA